MSVDHVAASLLTLRRVVLYLVIPALFGVSAGLIGLGVYALDRQAAVDRTAQHTRQAVCAVLRSIPTGQRSHAVRQALTLDDCANLTVPTPHLATVPGPKTTTPGATVTATARATATAAPAVTLSPHPRVTVTRRASPRPTVTHTRTIHPSHSPKPEPSPSCLLGIRTTLTCPKK